jgi:hypothetical protein
VVDSYKRFVGTLLPSSGRSEPRRVQSDRVAREPHDDRPLCMIQTDGQAKEAVRISSRSNTLPRNKQNVGERPTALTCNKKGKL